MPEPRSIEDEKLLDWWSRRGLASGRPKGLTDNPVEHIETLGMPAHLVLLAEMAEAAAGHSHGGSGEAPGQRAPVPTGQPPNSTQERSPSWHEGALDSIPFYSLCHGVFLPLMMLDPQWASRLFGVANFQRLGADQRMTLVNRFLTKSVGLTMEEKIGCLFCDPFHGIASRMRQDMLLRLLMGVQLMGRTNLLARLAQVKDVAVLFAESRNCQRGDPPLTAAEMLRSIRAARDVPLRRKMRILRGLLNRCGRLEAFVFAKLLLGKNGPGLAVPMPHVVQSLAACLQVDEGPVKHAVALTDIFRVARILEREGVEGLRAIRLQPLSPIRPALASGSTNQQTEFPTWVERKYDGVRFLLHKSTGATGSVLCGAYTRNGNDWLELAAGLDQSIRLLPAHSLILDCELYGTLPTTDGPRPATVYEVIAALRGDQAPLSLRLAAFDVLYINGEDVTRRTLQDRQLIVSNLCAALPHLPLPIPINMAEGQVAHNANDVNRLYHHFRAQGYEGVITKMLDAPYLLGGRDPNWLKRKPEETLDVVLLGATFSASERHQGSFGSYVLGALNDDGGFDDIGDVDGVDRERDSRIMELILRDSLLTGRRIERKLTEGSRIGVELRPGIVVTVVFQEVMREGDGALQLRHPRIKVIRSDKTPDEIDTVETIEEMHRAEQLQ